MAKYFIVDNTLTGTEKKYLTEICSKFVHDAAPYTNLDGNNFYFKKLIPNEDYIKLESFLDFNKQYFNKFSYDTNGLTPSDIWINKLTPESNLNDPLHRDVNELSTVTFLNSNFEGGELEIEVDNSIQLLRPKQGKSLIFEGNKIRHRALPVISGERYTMVVFWKLPVKNQKTLL